MARKVRRTRSTSRPATTFQTLNLPALGDGWLFLALLGATLLAYSPAWHGGFLWDDVGATQQYYPVTHAAFWLQHRLWGDATFGYHLVNIALHATSAFLMFRLLRTLAVPGAALAAAVFALHPIHVESVAWIAELKNTWSGVFVLASALAYLRFDADRSRRTYLTALALFALALLSKTVTAPLPGVLLVVMWWKRGRLDLRRDVLPLVPFAALALGAGLLTTWFERTLIGAYGSEFQLSFLERCLVAGRVVWFYFTTLLFPVGLSFNYPRWAVSQSVWWQYLFPLAVVAVGAVFWMIRARSRAPLTTFLIFGGLLVPVLGFVDVYPFRFSYVADHFAYLASIPLIAVLAAGLTQGWRTLERRQIVGAAAVAGLLAGLAALTYMQARPYASAEALYRHTIERNPNSWLAHNNLALALMGRSLDEALFHSNQAASLNPADPVVHNDRGSILQRLGRTEAAIAEFREAIRLSPGGFATAHNNLCSSLGILQRYEDAIAACREALKQSPGFGDAHYNMGTAMLSLGDVAAADEFSAAIAAKPELAEAHYYLGGMRHLRGERDDARRHYEDAIRLKPDLADAHYNLGRLLQETGQDAEAIRRFEAALRIVPTSAEAHNSLGVLLTKTGRDPEALVHFEEAVRLLPSLGEARANLIRARERQAASNAR
jgi:tetratricopeptide (TPR) repeat protein